MPKNRILTFISFSAFLILSACSLDYMKSEDSESTTPEFIFNKASFTRYESGIIKIKMNAAKIEQYKSDGSTYAKNAAFNSYDSKGTLETTGTCGLLEAKTDTEKYKLFDEIYLDMVSQKMKIYATSLFFDKKTEQIVSDVNSSVTLKKDDMEISGTGFSASGVNKSFNFEEGVSGTITTEENQEGEQDEDISDQ